MRLSTQALAGLLLVLSLAGCALPGGRGRSFAFSDMIPGHVPSAVADDGRPTVRRAILQNKTSELALYSSLNDTARYLAGMPGGTGSRLKELREDEEWNLHTNNINELWRRYDSLRRAPVESWASQELGGLRSPDCLFYPFSGPDFLFADTFFPGARTTILCGLESAEMLPDVAALDEGSRHAALDGIYTSLTSALNFSFFITKDMRVDLQRTQLKGTLPLILVFMARTGKDVDEVKAVGLSPDGAVVPAGTAGSNTPGLMIRYRSSRVGGDRVCYYFNTNLADDGFTPGSRFARFVRSQGACVSFTKSASYLMHESYFHNVRNAVLDQSIAVLQDDSGIPLKSFSPNNWDVQHFGKYSGVLDIFTKYYQPDLAEAHAGGASPLGFGIGYKHQNGQSAMILARRRR